MVRQQQQSRPLGKTRGATRRKWHLVDRQVQGHERRRAHITGGWAGGWAHLRWLALPPARTCTRATTPCPPAWAGPAAQRKHAHAARGTRWATDATSAGCTTTTGDGPLGAGLGWGGGRERRGVRLCKAHVGGHGDEVAPPLVRQLVAHHVGAAEAPVGALALAVEQQPLAVEHEQAPRLGGVRLRSAAAQGAQARPRIVVQQRRALQLCARRARRLRALAARTPLVPAERMT